MPQYVKYFFVGGVGGVILIVSSSAYNKLQLQQFLHINFHSADVDKLFVVVVVGVVVVVAVAGTSCSCCRVSHCRC